MSITLKILLSSGLTLFHHDTHPGTQTNDASALLENWIQRRELGIESRTATEDWASAQLKVRTEPRWQAWSNHRKMKVNDWFAVPRDRFELNAGYPNDYVDPATGSSLTWSPQSAEPKRSGDTEALRRHAAWAAINRQYNISRTLEAAKLYRLSGEQRYLEITQAQLDFYADSYLKWPLKRSIGNARMLAQSLDEASAVVELVEAARLISGSTGEKRRLNWRKSLFEPVAANLQTYRDRELNNIDLWCAVSLAHIAMYLDDKTLLNIALHGKRGIDAILTDRTTADGVWYEGSFSYSTQVLTTLAKLFEGYAALRASPPPDRYAAAAKRLLLGPLLFRYGNFTMPNPGDARSPTPPLDIRTLLSLYRHIPTYQGLARAEQETTWNTLLDPPEKTPSERVLEIPPTPSVVIARNARMAMLRQGGWELFVRAGQATPNHAQEEATNYELMHEGRNIVHDAGTAPTYSNPLHMNYFAKGIGNNVPLIDGKGQQSWNPGDIELTTSPATTLTVTHRNYHREYAAERRYTLYPDGLVETTLLTSTNADAPPRRLGIVINSPCTIIQRQGEPRNRENIPAIDAFMPELKPWHDTRFTPATTNWSSTLDCTGNRYDLEIRSTQPFTAITGITPSTPLPATRTSIYVVTKGRSAEITTTVREASHP